ncbi:hypothetical protein QLL95_gp1234 [Cotonvirus japonicus]|uniref:Uncharacterized protein n=1 Tax=Cotonvirus japonicus TaxID=2811091 RepID=A0ABM7NRW4_9VIRU|nr:hypothetical protein QLL95_gp1234 [Cotonvirus japonicus]BCS82889.1 hypothetical protein [Cotonvirus japonicus]
MDVPPINEGVKIVKMLREGHEMNWANSNQKMVAEVTQGDDQAQEMVAGATPEADQPPGDHLTPGVDQLLELVVVLPLGHDLTLLPGEQQVVLKLPGKIP